MSGVAPEVRLLAVGLDEHEVELAGRVAGPGAVVAVEGARAAREWLTGRTGVSVVVAARFREPDVWALNTLLAALRIGDRCTSVLLRADVPRAALPVLITDHPGLLTLDPDDPHTFEAALTAALARTTTIASRCA